MLVIYHWNSVIVSLDSPLKGMCILTGDFLLLLEMKIIYCGCNFSVKDLHENFSIKPLIVLVFLSIIPSPVLWLWEATWITPEGSVTTENTIYVLQEKSFVINFWEMIESAWVKMVLKNRSRSPLKLPRTVFCASTEWEHISLPSALKVFKF